MIDADVAAEIDFRASRAMRESGPKRLHKGLKEWRPRPSLPRHAGQTAMTARVWSGPARENEANA